MTMTLKFKDKPVPSDSLTTNDNIDPNARLFAATKRLREVSEQQVIKVRKYKNVISNLNEKVKQLKNSWITYDRAVGRINVKPLRENALNLGKIMDDGLRAL